jgi:hypothetical protein
MRTAVDFIEHHRKRGTGVYIHCKSGRGRSAAIAMGWLIQVKKLSPLKANEHLLKVRKVRGKLFLQTNIINFYNDLKKAAAEATLDADKRTVDYATPWSTSNRRNSTNDARNMLTGGNGGAGSGKSAPASAGKGSVLTSGTGSGFMRNFSFRQGGGGGGERPSMLMDTARYGYGGAPPDWSKTPSDGVWTINVAPLAPKIPDRLPQWCAHPHPALPLSPSLPLVCCFPRGWLRGEVVMKSLNGLSASMRMRAVSARSSHPPCLFVWCAQGPAAAAAVREQPQPAAAAAGGTLRAHARLRRCCGERGWLPAAGLFPHWQLGTAAAGLWAWERSPAAEFVRSECVRVECEHRHGRGRRAALHGVDLWRRPAALGSCRRWQGTQ